MNLIFALCVIGVVAVVTAFFTMIWILIDPKDKDDESNNY
jgi:hypothetical protein